MLAKIYDALTIILILSGAAVIAFLFINRDELFNQNGSEKEVDLYEDLIKKEIKISSRWVESNQGLRDRKIYTKEDLNVILFAGELNNPQKIEVISDEYVVVTEPSTGNVVVLRDTNGDNSAEEKKVFVSNLNKPFGVSYFEDDLYVATESSVLVFDNFIDQVERNIPNFRAVVSGLPIGGLNPYKSLLVGPGDLIFVGVGSSCDACIESDKRRGSIVSYNLDGSSEKIYASGLRNVLDMGFVNGRLYALDNSVLEPRSSDELNLISQGSYYGWPYVLNENDLNENIIDDSFDLPDEYVSPSALFDANSNPAGFAYLRQDFGFEDGFMLSFNGISGHDSLSKIIGFYNLETSELSPLLSFWYREDEFLASPVDIDPHKNGFLVTDELNGNVYFID